MKAKAPVACAFAGALGVAAWCVEPANAVTMAVDDNYVFENVLAFLTPNILANDSSDSPISQAVIFIQSFPLQGFLILSLPDIEYAPHPDFVGFDFFTYLFQENVNSQVFSNVATVTIEVTGPTIPLPAALPLFVTGLVDPLAQALGSGARHKEVFVYPVVYLCRLCVDSTSGKCGLSI